MNGLRIDGMLAQGRDNQSHAKNDLLVRFASRVCDGTTRPDEVAYMLAFMAQDIADPSRT